MEQKGFKIPDDYFGQKKANLRAIAEQDLRQNKSKRFKRNWYWMAAAALIALAVYLIPFQQKESENLQFSDLQEEEIIDFLSEDPNAIYPESFVSFHLEDSLSDVEAFDEELIENYLNENTIDYL